MLTAGAGPERRSVGRDIFHTLLTIYESLLLRTIIDISYPSQVEHQSLQLYEKEDSGCCLCVLLLRRAINGNPHHTIAMYNYTRKQKP